ncbi:MAG: hypothetical protein II566_04585 [Lachnospiraceae bacterium]|nr:hypothetical protein [Lachnospiraceae bacterium]MBQ2576526.1 hypothetical protein [Lachnospiraceae bacterium]MCR4731671.1 hypothetical protein [Lachnospiraceae bacterium]MEE3355073.1 hypothetical protein [Candidatus Weimeria sp.]
MLFFKKKKKDDPQAASFERVMERIKEIDDWENPKKIEHYILDSCEQIISGTKEIEAEKAEYRVLTKYLQDIRTLSKLRPEQEKDIRKAAAAIDKARRSKDEFLHAPKAISDDAFRICEMYEDEMPREILRMKENERYQARVQSEMHSLEAEKGSILLDRDEAIASKRNSRNVSLLVLIMFGSIMILLLILKEGMGIDTDKYFGLFLLIAALFSLLLFLWQSNSTRQKRRYTRQLNKTIELLNVCRMKYANVTKAIMSQQKRYHVRSAHELEYQFVEYQNLLDRRKKFEQDDEDLSYWNGYLMRLLGPLGLYDSKIWLSQAGALVHEEDMREVNHNLVVRRQAVRERIRENTASVKSDRDEIDRMMKEHDYYVPEIREIIASVDKLCGLRSKKEEDINE